MELLFLFLLHKFFYITSKMSLYHHLALVLGIVYLVAILQSSTQIKYLLKPIVTLLLAYPTSHKPQSRGVFYGLLLSTIGDAFLMIPREDMFVPGLLSFLAAHIFYIYSFQANIPSWDTFSWQALPLGFYAGVILSLLRPGIVREDLPVQIGVVVYVMVIMAMVYRASLSSSYLLILGTLLFGISDTILAWDKFLQPQEWGEFAIMSTYYAAQLCISVVHS